MPGDRAVRKPLSCGPCRHRKLRCDRGVPACSNCVHRGDIIACSYAQRSRPTSGQPPRSPASGLDRNAQDKLDQLEKLVVSLFDEKRNANQVVTPASTRDAGSSDGHVVSFDSQQAPERSSGETPRSVLSDSSAGAGLCGSSEPRWSVDEARWASLMNGINDVRDYLRIQHEKDDQQNQVTSSSLERSCDDSGPTLLFGSSRSMSDKEILSHLPSRHSCDIMVERYFAHLYPPLHILHIPTFRKQYARFWMDPLNTSMAWVGLLYAMLRIAALDYLREEDEPLEWQGKCQDLAINFRNRFTDCMIAADYLQPQEYLIEALCLHHYGEYVSSRDAKSSVWVLTGMITRLAMRMGYHQTSQPTLESSPCKDEMRRRVWAFIRQGDIMISFQLGLPAMVDLWDSDANLPRNIYDADLDEDCTELPPALPDSEPTEVAFLLAKTKLAFGFSRAAAEINRSPSVRYERILEIDRELRHVYDSIPGSYKLGALSQQDSLIRTSAKFTLANIHHKSLCVVHSRFMKLARSDNRYSYSRKVCLQSAMSMLRIQAIQDQDIPVDGRIRSLTNYQTSLTIHDFLLAAAIISSDLCSSNSSPEKQTLTPGFPSRADMTRALSISAQIFGRTRDCSREAGKAADVLSMLVNKLEAGESAPNEARQLARQKTTQARGFQANGQPAMPHQRQGPSPASKIVSGAALPLSAGMTSDASAAQEQPSWPGASDPWSQIGLPQLDTNYPPIWPYAPFHTSADWSATDPCNFGHEAGLSGNLDSSHWNPSIAMHDPLSTLWDLSAEFGTDALVPFSVFPSSYKNEQTTESTEVKTDEHITVQGAGREGQRDRNTQQGPSRRDDRYSREDIRISEEDRRRPGRVKREEDIRITEDDRYTDRRDTRVEIDRERYREPYQRYAGSQIDVEDRVYDREYNTRHTPATQIDVDTRIDVAERDFRDRTVPFAEEYRSSRGWQDQTTYPRDVPQGSYPERNAVRFDENVRVTEDSTVDGKHKRDMGYYDEDGQYHSFRHGLHRAADRILHPIHGGHHHHDHHHHHQDREDREVVRERDVTVEDREVQVGAPRISESRTMYRSEGPSRRGPPNTITIPCHFIRIGDILILQGRPCQIIRITTSAQTGQHRYLGVDLFTKQLNEESSFISNPSPSVVVQNMLGPVFKQYRVLDIRDDGRVVAMTETGDVKQTLPVLDQSNLLDRLSSSFANGRGSVRVLVLSDDGREMAVDYKVVHGSRL
ncbi:uncharacterized protein LTR77_005133 [Saxophila tyrrhenica]|uniref:Zn(2)-C6 fungal-type domain-containing protein n=1 Tax=Saxophila tyrrhenica TaxID=1690608 RepID=A0AAV9PBU2_9PEZI|nr:hypothetical protein LTR77_005133 [Saxophila tyrrhenica]